MVFHVSLFSRTDRNLDFSRTKLDSGDITQVDKLLAFVKRFQHSFLLNATNTIAPPTEKEGRPSKNYRGDLWNQARQPFLQSLNSPTTTMTSIALPFVCPLDFVGSQEKAGGAALLHFPAGSMPSPKTARPILPNEPATFVFDSYISQNKKKKYTSMLTNDLLNSKIKTVSDTTSPIVQSLINSFKPTQNSIVLELWQKEAADYIDQGKSLLVTAPTGAGKTMVALHAIQSMLEKSPDQKLVFCCPTKAMVNQIFAEIYNKFYHLKPMGCCSVVGLFTGSLSSVLLCIWASSNSLIVCVCVCVFDS